MTQLIQTKANVQKKQLHDIPIKEGIMHDFQYHQNELYCEGVAIKKIADLVDTPFYLYSNHTLENHFKVFDSAFSKIDHLTCFSVKANSNLTVLKIFINLGGGADIVSGGELYRVLNAGVDPSKVVFSGVGKGTKELKYALEAGILMFNIESAQELTTINQVAQRLGTKARIALRVNPHIDPKTHPYISTGLKKNKFGIEINQALEDYREAKKLKHLEIIGVDCHIGSQITEIQPFVETLRKVKELVVTLRQEDIEIQYIDLGGGLGIPYERSNDAPPLPMEYGQLIKDTLGDLGCEIEIEPGRLIAGNAGILVAQVIYVKQGEDRQFLILDAAMNDLIRPAMYEAHHDIIPVVEAAAGVEQTPYDIVGPICESGDTFAKHRNLAPMAAGELVAFRSAGAYGAVMASEYNSRPMIPEVLVDGHQFAVIRARPTLEDMINRDIIPEWL